MYEKNDNFLIKLHHQSNFEEIYKLTIHDIEKYKNDFISLKIISNSALKTENYVDSIRIANLALELIKNDIDIHNIIATSYSKTSEHVEALKILKKSYSLDKKNITTINLLGITYLNLNYLIEAKETFEKLINLAPLSTNGIYNLALVYFNLQKFKQAEKYILKLLESNKENDEANLLLAMCQKELGKNELSLQNFKKLLEKHPNNDELLYNIGKIYEVTNYIDLAKKFFKKAILTNSAKEDYFNALGVCLYNNNELKDAEEVYLSTAKKFPNSKYVFHNLGILYYDFNNFDKALKFLDKNLVINPNDANSKFVKSTIYLAQGNFDVGWEYYKWRIQGKYYKNEFTLQFTKKRLLKLSDAINKTILVRYEQGRGDIFQFSRYLKLLIKENIKVIFWSPKILSKLIKSLDTNIIIITKLNSDINYDYFCTLLDLPKIFNTQPNTIPSFDSYLKASHISIEKWSKKIDKTKFNIGVFWQGSTKPVDKGRSCKLKLFSKISKLKNVCLISLQKNYGSEQIIDFKKNNEIFDFTNEIDLNDDFEDTAGIIKNLDLVITVDSSIPHLAGALGTKVWVLLKFVPDWRWLESYKNIDNGTKTDWYPNMRLYKQNEINNWSNVFDNIYFDIKKILQKKY